jgi:acetylornithine deacetylase
MLSETSKRVLDALVDDEVVKLEQAMVQIPSFTFEEADLAEYLAGYMSNAGIETTLHEIEDPGGSGRKSKQPVGVIRGNGSGKSLLFIGHMDHNPLAGEWTREPFGGEIDGDYLYGRGSIDEKGGIAGLVMAGVAIKNSGVSLDGDLLLCPVMGHKSGAVGTRYLMENGILGDAVINTENSGLGIASAGIGVVRGTITFRGRPVHFRTPPEEVEKSANPIVHVSRFVNQLGKPNRTLSAEGWVSFQPDPRFPGFPQFGLDGLSCERLPSSYCTLQFQVRIIPGQDIETVEADINRVLDEMRSSDPTLDATVEFDRYSPPYSIDDDEPIVSTISRWHELVRGERPEVGAGPRLGSWGDASLLAIAGIPSVQYGPGASKDWKQWPTPDECIYIPDLIAGAKVMALTAADWCGAH